MHPTPGACCHQHSLPCPAQTQPPRRSAPRPWGHSFPGRGSWTLRPLLCSLKPSSPLPEVGPHFLVNYCLRQSSVFQLLVWFLSPEGPPGYSEK